ncbi:MAG: hypothetical protein IJ557_02510 [Bacteroidaceae bacterium]|nr:hypothetical protein [Bacteroidaceae bacterium]
MNICNEKFLADVVRVYPLSAGQIDFALPETVRNNTVTLADLGFANLAALEQFLVGKTRFTTVDADNETMPMPLDESPDIKVDTVVERMGHVYDISIGLRTLQFTSAEKAVVKQMERSGHDYILERIDGSYSLVRNFTPAQLVTHTEIEREGEHYADISIKMRNVTGIQDIEED